MKNMLNIVLVMVLILLSLTACSSDLKESNSDTTVPDMQVATSDDVSNNSNEKNDLQETIPDTTAPATPDTTENDAYNEGNKVSTLPFLQDTMEFSFLSGAGAWRTILTISSDGSFTGWYLDSEMGDRTDVYPNGSAYVCSFTGKFKNIRKIDEYSYRMTLTQVETEKSVGEEWIEDGIRYIASVPYGVDEGTEFVFYLPDMPIENMSQEFLSWWPYRYDQNSNPKATLSCYGIRNVAAEYGFFYAE